jgi:hypothetical protein
LLRIDLEPKPHLIKWTLVTRIEMRRFDTQAKAETERGQAVDRGERAYVIPPRRASGS